MNTRRKTQKEARKIVSDYFGGYMPKSLEEEGMKCSCMEELFCIIMKIEVYYINEHPELDFSDRHEELHRDITELVERLNNR